MKKVRSVFKPKSTDNTGRHSPIATLPENRPSSANSARSAPAPQSLLSSSTPIRALASTSMAHAVPRAFIELCSASTAAPPLPQIHSSARQTGWSVLKQVLSAVRDGSDLFLPLKATAVGIVEIMDTVDRVDQVQNECEELACNISVLQEVFRPYVLDHEVPPGLRIRLEVTATALGQLKETINKKTQRRGVRRVLESADDVDTVQSCFRYVSFVIKQFEVGTQASIEKEVWSIVRGQESDRAVNGQNFEELIKVSLLLSAAFSVSSL